MRKDISYFRDKLLALRNAQDDLLKEMDKEIKSSPSRNRRQRVEPLQFSTTTWRKPEAVKKTKNLQRLTAGIR